MSARTCHPSPTPKLGALAVVHRGNRVLLVRRVNPPQAGHWGFPGGHVDWLEPVAACAARELREETGVIAVAEAAMAPVEFIAPQGGGEEAAHHFILIPVRMRAAEGEAAASSDVSAVGWFSVDALPAPLCDFVEEVARAAVAQTGADTAASTTRAPGML